MGGSLGGGGGVALALARAVVGWMKGVSATVCGVLGGFGGLGGGSEGARRWGGGNTLIGLGPAPAWPVPATAVTTLTAAGFWSSMVKKTSPKAPAGQGGGLPHIPRKLHCQGV